MISASESVIDYCPEMVTSGDWSLLPDVTQHRYSGVRLNTKERVNRGLVMGN